MLFGATLVIWKKCKKGCDCSLLSCCSGKSNPMHGQCPLGSSWCTYQRAQSAGKVFYDKNAGLPKVLLTKLSRHIFSYVIKIFWKCLHGKTQNANEAFNGCLWNVVPKEIFVELQTFSLGSYSCNNL
ncbi:uncharacterized protein TNCV_749661 [Trichonephila clavipes]|nr:uncharacterized protein TNCV_749661 [Trichonephila clavipes]